MKIREMMKSLKKETGATMVEYALVVGLIAIVAIGALSSLGESISNAFTNVSENIDSALDK